MRVRVDGFALLLLLLAADVAFALKREVDNYIYKAALQTRIQIMAQMKRTFQNTAKKSSVMTKETSSALERFESSLETILRDTSKAALQDTINPNVLAVQTLQKLKDSWIQINSEPMGLTRRSLFNIQGARHSVPEIKGLEKVHDPKFYLQGQRQAVLDTVLAEAGKPLDLMTVLNEIVLPIETQGWSIERATRQLFNILSSWTYLTSEYVQTALQNFFQTFDLSEEQVKLMVSEIEVSTDIDIEMVQAIKKFEKDQIERDDELKSKLATIYPGSGKSAEIRHEAAKRFWSEAKELINKLFEYQMSLSGKSVERTELEALKAQGRYWEPTKPLVLEPRKKRLNLGLLVVGGSLVASLILNLVLAVAQCKNNSLFCFSKSDVHETIEKPVS
jgi:hypothetical protein